MKRVLGASVIVAGGLMGSTEAQAAGFVSNGVCAGNGPFNVFNSTEVRSLSAGDTVTITASGAGTNIRVRWIDQAFNAVISTEVDGVGIAPNASVTYTAPALTFGVELLIGDPASYTCESKAATNTAPISSRQLSDLTNLSGSGQFGAVNPLAGPQVSGSPTGGGGTPAGGGGPTGGGSTGGGGNGTGGGTGGGSNGSGTGSGGDGTGNTGGGEGGDDDSASNFAGGLSSIGAALAAFYELPTYSPYRPEGLSDLSYQYQTGHTFGADPMLRLEQNASPLGFGVGENAYTQLPFGANGDFRIWGYGAYTSFQNDRLRTEADGTVSEDSRQDGESFAINLGGDFQVNPDLLVGLSFGFTMSQVDTIFNGGSYDENLLTFAPYLLHSFWQDRLNVGLTAGYGIGEAEISTTANATADDAGTSMIFTSLDLSGGDHLFGTPLSAEGSFTYTFVEKELDGFLSNDGTQNPVTISTTHDLTFGSEIRYDLVGEAVTVQPFGAADLVWQLEDTINKDPIFGNVGGGLRLIGTNSGLSGQFEVTETVGRSDFQQTSFEGTVSYTLGLGRRQVTSFTPYLATAFSPETVGFRTGIDLTSHNDAIGASLSWSQDRDRDLSSDGINNVFRFDAKLRF